MARASRCAPHRKSREGNSPSRYWEAATDEPPPQKYDSYPGSSVFLGLTDYSQVDMLGVQIQIHHLSSGKEPGLTKLASPNTPIERELGTCSFEVGITTFRTKQAKYITSVRTKQAEYKTTSLSQPRVGVRRGLFAKRTLGLGDEDAGAWGFSS